MREKDFQDFVYKYGFTKVEHTYDDRRNRSYVYQHGSASHYNELEYHRELSFDMSIRQENLEVLMADAYDGRKWYQQHKLEQHLRKENPGLQKAYEQYQMLLELYK
jgi:hypothetical protein